MVRGGAARWMGVASLVCALGIAVLAGSAEGARAPRAEASKAKLVRLRMLSTSQHNMLRLRYVRVRVKVARRSRLRLVVRSGRRAVTKTKLVRLRHRGRRTVHLRLTSRGRRIVGGCASQRLGVSGRARVKGIRHTRRLGRSSRAVRRDRRRCPRGRAPAAANPGPLGTLHTENADRCDFLDPSECLYPWPNDHFTRADSSTPTGRRLNLQAASMPANKSGRHISPTDQNRADGWSPGNLMVTKVPGLDNQAAFDRTGLVPINDMARSFDPNQPAVVIDAQTGQRQLIWAEVDANPPNRRDAALIIRPGKNLTEGHRYIVALRNLKDASGHLLAARPEFRAYRDNVKTTNPAIEGRRAHFESLFATLARAGIARKSLYLTWDFTVASEKSLTGRALAMRNDAFAQLGDTNLADGQIQGTSPLFVQNPDIPDSVANAASQLPLPSVGPADFGNLDGVHDYAPCSAGSSSACEPGESDTTARVVTGQLRVPCYLNTAGCPPGAGFANGTPKRQAAPALANVICTVPRVAVDGGGTPGQTRISLYGHGLLGSASEVTAGNVQRMGQDHDFIFCATDWAGMSTPDVPNVLTLLQDLSGFNTLVDRIEQGYVNFMYLGRWLLHPQGAQTNTAFRIGGQPMIDDRALFYDGNSQGGILSGGLIALEPDITRAVQGVPGMNYSTLLRRSVDFDMYAKGEINGVDTPIGLYDNYTNQLERPLILSIMQLLWDRGESNGYAAHMTTDPLPGTPQHQTLMDLAFGDHQVANVTAETEARTIGASGYRPSTYPGRSTDKTPLYGIPSVPLDSPFSGSVLVYWDSGPVRTVGGQSHGTPPAPLAEVPPRTGNDPHGLPRGDAKAQQQKSDFLKVGGTFVNPCTLGGAAIPCYDDGFTGP